MYPVVSPECIWWFHLNVSDFCVKLLRLRDSTLVTWVKVRVNYMPVQCVSVEVYVC